MISVAAMMGMILVVWRCIRVLEENRVIDLRVLFEKTPLVVLGTQHQLRLKFCSH